ncbi:MAG: nucleotidyltransferase domain-containing protein [Fretibacterium sp.]|nr:nucleotidyltransferase domain-containing protein [Fretibacterium sp.]
MSISERALSLEQEKADLENNRALKKKVLGSFVEQVKERQGDNLLKIVLFGSVARGDDEPDSDIDVFVLLKDPKGTTDKYIENIVDIAYDIDLDEGDCKTYISPLVSVLESYEDAIRMGLPIYKAIQREGRVLYDAQA